MMTRWLRGKRIMGVTLKINEFRVGVAEGKGK